MLKKIVVLLGEPASGKTTLTKKLLSTFDWPHKFCHRSHGTLRYMLNKERGLVVFGNYSLSGMFDGTDALSATVINQAEEYIGGNFGHLTMFFEGDRLANQRFLNSCKAVAPTDIFFLRASPTTLAERHRARGDSQKASWLKGRATKIFNLMEAFPEARLLPNDRDDQNEEALKILRQAVWSNF